MEAYIFAEGAVRRTDGSEEIRAAHLAGLTMWVDLGERSSDGEALLAKTFGIHPLVIEDIFGERSAPKIDEYDDYIYVVIHGLRRTDDPLRADLGIMDVVIGRTFVLTQHREGPVNQRLRARLDATPGLLAQGPAWVAHAFMDLLIDRFLPFVELLRVRGDDLENQVVTHRDAPNQRDLLPDLFALKRSIQALGRIAPSEREILHRLSRDQFPVIPKDARPYFRDVFDHFSRVAEQLETYRDVVQNAIDAYLSVQANRMNETVKRLTLISTVMLPLTFVASFYGMNFKSMPEIYWPHGELFALGLMAAVSVSVWTWFKWKGWA
ncbi:MAG: magnesium/cobalt transporter CorA [Polyangiaceae bacterium]